MIERLLVVGLGSIGRRHTRIARGLVPGLQLLALRHAAAAGYGEPDIQSVAALPDALAFRAQAAVIASPATHHLETALPLARAGVHLFIEKPIASVSSGVDELISECRSRNLVLMIGYNLRFLPSLLSFRSHLRERLVGRVLSVRSEVGQYLETWRPGANYRNAVTARAELGGGVLLELSHEIDYLRWLFGEIEWVQAAASRQSELEIDVEDTAHLILGFEPSCDAQPVVATVNMDCIRHDTTRWCTVIGERGSLRWDGIAGRVEAHFAGDEAFRPLYGHKHSADESYIAEWEHFLRCIAQGTEPEVSGADGLAVLRVVEACREAARTGRRQYMRNTMR